jgi:hypothetical protein
LCELAGFPEWAIAFYLWARGDRFCEVKGKTAIAITLSRDF